MISSIMLKMHYQHIKLLYWITTDVSFGNSHDVGLVNSCHFLSAMLHSKVKCIFCNFGTFLLCHDLETFNNPINILQDNQTNNKDENHVRH